MDISESATLGDDISSHWYYRSKAAALTRLCREFAPEIILDVGAGSAFFSYHLLRYTGAQEAWCVDINYEKDSAEKDGTKTLYRQKEIGNIDCNLVLMMDVIEHVGKDVELVRQYVNKVPPGTRFVVTVPAFNFLWSEHDVFLKHKRRYSLKQLETVITKAGLSIDRSAYFFALVFPIALVTRLTSNWLRSEKKPAKSQLKRHHPLVNRLLFTCCRIELPFMVMNRLFGLSVFCAATKK